MATPEQLANLKTAYQAARLSEHIFPAMAACEVMVETRWGTSELYADYNNAFGQKQSVDVPQFLTVRLATEEILLGKPVTLRQPFVWFPTKADSFTARMRTLERLQNQYPHYKAALHAATAEEFVTEVSQSWSTAPDRAQNCIAIYHAHSDVFTEMATV